MRRSVADMRRRVALAGPFVAIAVLGVLFAGQDARSDPARYYLSLGDSISVGYQPAHDGLPKGRTSEGYADDVADRLRSRAPSLRLVKLGCPRETTTTMISGGICGYTNYGAKSQLAAATTFLATHRGQVRYLTLNIGINDVVHCVPAGASGSACVNRGLESVSRNLNTILAALRAADKNVPLSVGMTYYDPFLADWRDGTDGKQVAAASAGFVSLLNVTERSLYQRYGFGVADVAGAYRNDDSTPSDSEEMPANVQAVCALTYMCELRNIHPNRDGYVVIADAFIAQLQPAGELGQR